MVVKLRESRQHLEDGSPVLLGLGVERVVGHPQYFKKWQSFEMLELRNGFNSVFSKIQFGKLLAVRNIPERGDTIDTGGEQPARAKYVSP